MITNLGQTNALSKTLSRENLEEFEKLSQQVSEFLKPIGIFLSTDAIKEIDITKRGDLRTINLKLENEAISIYLHPQGNVTVISPNKTIVYNPQEGRIYTQINNSNK